MPLEAQPNVVRVMTSPLHNLQAICCGRADGPGLPFAKPQATLNKNCIASRIVIMLSFNIDLDYFSSDTALLSFSESL